MAYISPVKGETLKILVGDGESPTEAFTVQALVNISTSIDLNANVETEELVDLANLGAAGLQSTTVSSVTLTVTGEGTVHKANQLTWLEWMKSGLPKNVIIKQDSPAADGGWMIEASMLLTQFNMSGERRKNAKGQITLIADGEWTVGENA